LERGKLRQWARKILRVRLKKDISKSEGKEIRNINTSWNVGNE
jgi:hypothetical protein